MCVLVSASYSVNKITQTLCEVLQIFDGLETDTVMKYLKVQHLNQKRKSFSPKLNKQITINNIFVFMTE